MTDIPARRVLVTGAQGYLGTRVVDALLQRGHDVGVLVRREARGLPRTLSEVLTADIAEPLPTPSGRYDVVIHLAAANDVASRDPATALRVTTLGTRRVIELCRAAGIAGLVYVSTTQVFGADEGDIDESSPLRGRNDYALTHLFAEQYTAASELDWVIARPANVFGAPASRAQSRWTLVPSCFCKEAHETGRITLLSSGRQQRDFLGAGDVAALLGTIAERSGELRRRSINLSSGRSTTVLAVAERVAARYRARHGRACEIRVASDLPPEGRPLHVSTRLRETLGLVLQSPQSMDEEIDRTFGVLEAP